MDGSIYLVAPVAGWLIAQGIKFVLTLRKDGVSIKDAFQSGGMPSSHSAFMVALTTVIGIKDGFDTPIFGLSAAISAIVMYDARGVRLATGQQTVAIKKLAKKNGVNVSITNAKGHRIIEVAAGAVVGIIVGLITVNIS